MGRGTPGSPARRADLTPPARDWLTTVPLLLGRVVNLGAKGESPIGFKYSTCDESDIDVLVRMEPGGPCSISSACLRSSRACSGPRLQKDDLAYLHHRRVSQPGDHRREAVKQMSEDLKGAPPAFRTNAEPHRGPRSRRGACCELQGQRRAAGIPVGGKRSWKQCPLNELYPCEPLPTSGTVGSGYRAATSLKRISSSGVTAVVTLDRIRLYVEHRSE